MLAVALPHHLPLGSDERLHAVGTAQQVVPGRFVEGDGLTVRGAGVMVQRPAPHAIEAAAVSQLAEAPARPFQVSAARTGPDEREVDAVPRYRPGGEAAVLGGVFLRREVAAASPGLVADPPV